MKVKRGNFPIVVSYGDYLLCFVYYFIVLLLCCIALMIWCPGYFYKFTLSLPCLHHHHPQLVTVVRRSFSKPSTPSSHSTDIRRHTYIKCLQYMPILFFIEFFSLILLFLVSQSPLPLFFKFDKTSN